MTDNEIIKALECCTHNGDWNMVCSECPFSNSINCRVLLARNALSLINRQQAEIERLNRDLDLVVRNYIEATKTAMQLARGKAIKEFAEIVVRDYPEMEFYLHTLVKEMVGDDNG